MPLLEIQQQSKKVTATVTLEQSTATSVDQYAAFIHATADEVVNKALDYVFAKDKQFQSFLATDAANSVPNSLRVKGAKSGTETVQRRAKASSPALIRA